MIKIEVALKFFITIAVFISLNQATAGSPSRPYLIWANLHEYTNPNITTIVNQYIQTLPADEFCNESAFGWIIYSKTRPPGFSNSLIKKALDSQQGLSARNSLAKNIEKFKADNINDGLDGVVAYDETNYPHMASIDSHKKVMTSKRIFDEHDKRQVIDAFCSVIPRTYRN